MPEPTMSPDEVLELAKKATEGPWVSAQRDRKYIVRGFRNKQADEEAIALVYSRRGQSREQRDDTADFIAAARTALPAYAEALKVAEAALEKITNMPGGSYHCTTVELKDIADQALSRIHALVKFGGTT